MPTSNRSSELRLPTKVVAARLTLVGGTPIDAELFVADIRRRGRSHLLDAIATQLGGESTFMPMRWDNQVRLLAKKGHTVTQPADLLKDPYILEFVGLEEKAAYTESDLEAAIIGKLQRFLLELGKGFLFEARQKRFTLDEDHFFVDLVFYNRLLRCYVLVDLKIGKLTHQDLGQMQMYVNYFDRHVKTTDEHSTVGIILCKKKHEALVEITLPRDANIHAREYQLYLPSKEELRRKLVEWAGEQEGRR